MKILYDYQIFTNQIYGGISRYFFELMKNFENDNRIKYDLSLRYSNNYYLNKYNDLKYKPFFKNLAFRGKYKLLNILNKKVSKKYISKGDYDIFHPTYFDPYFLNFLNNKPFVLTICDMINEVYPKLFLSNNKTAERKKLLAQKATKIIAISENTKKDIIKFLNIKEDKIEVIYLANSLNLDRYYPSKNITFSKKYILFIGDRQVYKNFNLFVEAVSILFLEDTELNLICMGGGKFKKIEIKKFNNLNIMDKVFQYSVSDNDLAYLYNKALAFIYPSLYEGFGIPILESFACRCPVIASKIGSFLEIAGDAAVYFDPLKKSSMLNSIKKVIYNNDIRNQLIKKGIQRTKKFTWAKTVEKTKSLYEGIL